MANFLPLRDFIFEAAQAAGLGEQQLWKLDLAFEEALTNVIRHAYPQDAPGAVAVGYRADAGTFVIQVRDHGRRFNPLEGADPDLSLSLEQRPVGGLGRYLVRTLASRADYAWQDGVNILTVELSTAADA